MILTNNINTLLNLIQNENLKFNTISFKELDVCVKESVNAWIAKKMTGIPIEELGFSACLAASFDSRTKIYIFTLHYDGSYTGTDPCYGDAIFISDGISSKFIFDKIKCAD